MAYAVSPDVSVIIPVYNAEKYLAFTVNSVLTQTHKNIELILVDDGSADGSAAMCDDFASSDSRVRAIHKENGGVGSARNVGIDAASGKYICFVDADDFVLSELVFDNYSLAEQNDADMIMYGMQIEWDRQNGANYDRTRIDLPPLGGAYTLEEYWDNFRNGYLLRGSVCMYMFRREFINKYGVRFGGLKNGEDICFLFDVYSHPFGKIVFNRKAYYIQHKRSGSATQSYYSERADEEYEVSCRFDSMVHASPYARGRFDDMVSKIYTAGLCKTLENLARAGKSLTEAQKAAEVKRYLALPKVSQSLKAVPLGVYDSMQSKFKTVVLKLLLKFGLCRAAVKISEFHLHINS